MDTGNVYLREEDRSVTVSVSRMKDGVPQHIQDKWQKLIDLLSSIFEIPASLIMRLNSDSMEVFLRSNNPDNPYTPGAGEQLGFGLYCETAIGRDQPLEIHDALKDIRWKDNPDIKLGMISYLGYPLKWPDGSFFGTICSLDTSPRHYSGDITQLMQVFSSIIEADLKTIQQYNELYDEKQRLDAMLREIHHRIKNNLNMVLSYMQVHKNTSKETVQNLLGNIEARVRAFATLHERIYKSVSLNPVFSEYIKNLASECLIAMDREDIECSCTIDEISGRDFFLDTGMIVVELITNSLKYALKDPGVPASPKIFLEIRKEKSGTSIRYSDYGNMNIPESNKGFGMVMFEAFARRYSGNFTIEKGEYNTWIFRGLHPC